MPSTESRHPEFWRNAGAARGRRSAWPCALLALVLCVTSSCAFRALRRDLDRMSRFTIVNGTVEAQGVPETMVVVVLLDAASGAAIDSFVLGRRGEYFFLVDPGTYHVAAFIDANHDFHFDAARERGIWYGPPQPLALREGQRIDGVNFQFDDASAVPMQQSMAAPELGRRGMRDVPDMNLGTVTTIDDSRFSEENGRVGMWQPVQFALHLGPGIYFLDKHDEDKIPVIFVHGMGGNPADFAILIAGLDRSRFEPWLVYYPSGLPLDLLARALVRWMNSTGVRNAFDHFAIVAHSMGGLVARGAVSHWMQGTGDTRLGTLDAFVTISTPWAGHAAAAAGVEHAPEVVPAWYDMEPGSEFLRGIFSTALPPECQYFLLFGFEGGSRLMGYPNDGAVAVESQLAPAAQEHAVKVYGFPESHRSILQSKAVSARLNHILAAATNGN